MARRSWKVAQRRKQKAENRLAELRRQIGDAARASKTRTAVVKSFYGTDKYEADLKGNYRIPSEDMNKWYTLDSRSNTVINCLLRKIGCQRTRIHRSVMVEEEEMMKRNLDIGDKQSVNLQRLLRPLGRHQRLFQLDDPVPRPRSR